MTRSRWIGIGFAVVAVVAILSGLVLTRGRSLPEAAPGHAPIAPMDVAAPSGSKTSAETTGIELVPSAGVTLSGQLVDAATGEALPDKQIVFDSEAPTAQMAAQTDAEGFFFLLAVAPGKRTARLLDDELVITPDSASIVVAEGAPTQHLVLRAAKGGNIDGVRITFGKGGSISGIVVDTKGRPKKGVLISADAMVKERSAHDPPDTAWASSKEDGSFTIKELGAGEYQLSAERSGVSSIRDPVKQVKLGVGEIVTGLRIVALDGGPLAIAGRVENTRGRPIVNARVSLGGTHGSYGTETDTQGKFRFEGLKEGRFEIQVSHKSFPYSKGFAVAAGATDVKIIFKDPAIIEGRVLSAATGRPIPAFEIDTKADEAPSISFPSFDGEAISNADGEFLLIDVLDGTTTLILRATGFEETKIKIPRVAAGEHRRNVIVRMNDGATLSGRVVDAAGNPIAGAQVFLAGVEVPFFGTRQADAITPADGTFRLASLITGAIEFTVKHGNFAAKSVHANVAPNLDNPIVVVLTGGGSIEGVVTLDGNPMPDQDVKARSETDNDGNGTTDAIGRYRLSRLPTGVASVTVVLTIDGVRHDKTLSATVTEGAVTQLNFAFTSGSAAIEGTIFEAEGVSLKEPTRVSVTMGDDPGGGESFDTQSDKYGHYAVTGLPAGRAHITIQANDTYKAISVDLAAGRRVHRDIFLYGGSVVRVHISGNNALPVMALVTLISGEVEIDTPSLETWFSDSGALGTVSMGLALAGEAVLKAIEPGTYTLLVMSVGPAEMASPEETLSDSNWASKIIEVKKDEELIVQMEL